MRFCSLCSQLRWTWAACHILAHPKLKVFVTHGGQSSFQETLCHQKPALAIPVAGDQPLNAKEMERMGFGIAQPYATLDEKELFNALK